MAIPQQPEIRRSEHTSVGHTGREAGRSRPGEREPAFDVPEENQPGHHPDHEQDQPPEGAMAERLGIPREGAEAPPEEAEAAGERPSDRRSARGCAPTLVGLTSALVDRAARRSQRRAAH